jgi:hypothetical protein
MDAVQVDQEGRIRLRILKPGDYYEPAFVSPDIITLRRLSTSAPPPSLSAAAVKQAVLGSTLDLGAGYDEVRAITREPWVSPFGWNRGATAASEVDRGS